MQLHRDTSVASLTQTPSLVDGELIWEDSPLVRALTHGRVLVLDEADKAPLEVVCVLRSLIEEGRMLLADGRRVVPAGSPPRPRTLPLADGFRVIVLANRPGYPFLGNDFFERWATYWRRTSSTTRRSRRRSRSSRRTAPTCRRRSFGGSWRSSASFDRWPTPARSHTLTRRVRPSPSSSTCSPSLRTACSPPPRMSSPLTATSPPSRRPSRRSSGATASPPAAARRLRRAPRGGGRSAAERAA